MRGDRRIRAVFVLPDLSGGGAQRAVSLLVRHLARDRVEPRLIVLSERGAVQPIPEDVPVESLGDLRQRQAGLLLAKRLRRSAPDVIVSTLLRIDLMILGLRWMRLFRAPIVVRQTTTPSLYYANQRGMRELARHLYPRADAILCQTPVQAQDLRDWTGRDLDRVEVVPNVVDVASNAEPDWKVDQALAGPGAHFAAVGRLDRDKGYDVLLRAWRQVASRHPSAKLHVFGDGPEKKNLQAIIAKLALSQSVILHGYVLDVARYVGRCRALLFPSRYEGLPNAVIEALALGVPTIGSDIPALRTIVHPGVNGLLFPVGDADALAAQALAVMDGLVDFDGELVTSSVRAYRPDRVAPAIEKLLLKVANGASARR